MGNTNMKAVLEAILFAMGNSVTKDRLSEALEIDKKELKKLLEELKNDYESDSRGIELIELDNAVQLGTKGFAYEYLAKLGKTSNKYVLTDSLLETLSIVAYKQPVTRTEIEKIRGVSCDHAINKLLEYELIQELGRLEAPGRPLLFGTTEQFLRSFGVKSIGELPKMSPELMEDFRKQAEDEALVENVSDNQDDNEIINIDI